MIKRGSICPMTTAKVKDGTTEYGLKARNKGDRLIFLYLGHQKEGEELDPEEVLRDMGWSESEKEPEFTVMEKFYQKLHLAKVLVINNITSNHLHINSLEDIENKGSPICVAEFDDGTTFKLYIEHVLAATYYVEETGKLSTFYCGTPIVLELGKGFK